MKITRILHASVNTAGADDAAAFYRDVLGLEDRWRPDIPGVPGSWFAVGESELHLVGRAPSERAVDPSRHHVCFGVDDLDAAVAELTARHVDIVRGEQHHPGRVIQQVFFVDPAGNTIELQEDRDA